MLLFTSILILFSVLFLYPKNIFAAPVKDDPNGTYTDDFADATGLLTQSGAGVNVTTGKVQLRNSSSGYTAPYNTTGSVTTAVIRPLRIARFGTVNITGTFPEGTEVRLQVIDDGGTLYSDTYLAGNSTGILSFPVDISTIPPFLWANGDLGDKIPHARYKLVLNTTNTSITPEVDTFTVNWVLTQGDLSASLFDSSSPWTSTYGSNQKGNRVSRTYNNSIYPAVRWATDKMVGNSWAPTTYVLNNRIFASTGWWDGKIYTLNRDTGAITSQSPWATSSGNVIAQNGTIYGGTIGNDIITALDTTNSTVKWVYNLFGGHGNSYTTIGSDGTIFYLYATSGRSIYLYAFNPDSSIKFIKEYTEGEVGDWQVNPTALSLGDNGVLYYTYESIDSGYNRFGHSELIALSQTDGTILWSYPLGNMSGSGPLIDTDGTIYLCDYHGQTSTEKKIWAIYPDGTLKWEKSLGTGTRGIMERMIPSDGNLHAFEYKSPNVIEHIINKTDGSTISTETRSYYTPQFFDNNMGYYYTSADYTDPDLYKWMLNYYDDLNHIFKWQLIVPNPEAAEGYLSDVLIGRSVIDERGWVYSGIARDYYDDVNYENVHSEQYSQSFALAPWTLSSSLDSSTYRANATVTFTVTTSMKQTNPLLGGDNKVQVVMDNDDKVLLTYQSTNSSGDTVWTGTYNIPLYFTGGNHSYTVEASQAYIKTDVTTHFDTATTMSDNTGIISWQTICINYCSSSSSDSRYSEAYIQIPGMSWASFPNIIAVPIRDSNTYGQIVYSIILTDSIKFDAYLFANYINSQTLVNKNLLNSSSTKTNLIYSGNGSGTLIGIKSSNYIYWQISGIQDMWYKTYTPPGHSAAKIIPELQFIPSVVTFKYKDSDLIPPGYPNMKFPEKKLRLAYSLDGKYWTILSSSVVDVDNNTVSAVHKIGGYYMIVVNP